MSYTLVVKDWNGWKEFYTNEDLASVRRERDYLLNSECAPICYIINTQPAVEPVSDTVGRFVYALEGM